MASAKFIIATVCLAFFGSLIYWLIVPSQGGITPSSIPAVREKLPLEEPTVIETALPDQFEVDLTKPVLFDVPFTVQAPFAEWSDPRFQDACEEASVLMAMKWLEGKKFASRSEAKAEILALVDWQIENYGGFHDTSAEDTKERLFKRYYNHENVWVIETASDTEIISELQKGNLVVAPMNGQLLNNPSFTQPGPERHMVVVKGYDPLKNEFITNDPGISQGENYRYPVDIFVNAIRDYPTGNHQPITALKKTIIVVGKTAI